MKNNKRQTKKCPFCSEKILDSAKKCQFCGEWLEAKKSTQSTIGDKEKKQESFVLNCDEKNKIIITWLAIVFGVIILAVWSKSILVMSASIFVIWYLWKKTSLDKNKKTLATVGLVLFAIILMASSGSETEKKVEKAETSNAEKQDTKKTESESQPVKEDVIKLSILQPEKKNEEVTVDDYEIIGSVASSDVVVNITKEGSDVEMENIIVDSEGKFSSKVKLQKEKNVFNVIAKKGDEKTEKPVIIFRKITQEERDAELKAEAKTISYKELFRNIDKYKGEKVYYAGKVVQVIGDGKILSSMLVNITKGSYGFWDDTVLVANLDFDTDKILEDDIIKFWGTVEGEESYETVLGATVSLPSLSASIIELVK